MKQATRNHNPPPTPTAKAAAPRVRLPDAGRRRAVIENPAPAVDGGAFPVKRVQNEPLRVECDAFTDGHDRIRVVLRHRRAAEPDWRETEMRPLVNDRWAAEIALPEIGPHEYSVVAWVDRFAAWRDAFVKKVAAGQDVALELRVAARLLREDAEHAASQDAAQLRSLADQLEDEDAPPARRIGLATSEDLERLARRADPRRHAAELERPIPVEVDRPRAAFSAWYEVFPRSLGKPDAHGTLRDVIDHLPHVHALGFDVLYLPPIHPIGLTHRKGRNNRLETEPGDVGSPWAIGGPKADGSPGGHTDIHPELGTIDDFRDLVAAAEERGIEIALDIAFQCSPDHPWVREHPEWFTRLPDGSIRYAENPPKKYQDIYPINFDAEDWQNLWVALRDVFAYWVEQGVKIFRVDNPHTKAFGFWQWVIADLKANHPELIFLSEAFTRPKVMNRLAKIGFTQSYTYFAWRRDPWELEQYAAELTQTEVADFFRPNFWPNTPDILTDQLVEGGRPALMSRLVLAATLSSSYGVYAPPYEAGDVRRREPGSEEYLDSEKYQIRNWRFSLENPMSAFMARLNRIRADHPALHANRSLRFHHVANDRLLAYSKTDAASGDAILVVVNADARREQWGELRLDLAALGIEHHESFAVHDLLTGARYHWTGERQVVGLSPDSCPAHVFHVERQGQAEATHDEFDSV